MISKYMILVTRMDAGWKKHTYMANTPEAVRYFLSLLKQPVDSSLVEVLEWPDGAEPGEAEYVPVLLDLFM